MDMVIIRFNLSNTIGFFPDYVCCGHKHFCFYSQESKFIQSGSLASSGDDYCIEKRLSGKASQMVCIVDKNGCKKRTSSNVKLKCL